MKRRLSTQRTVGLTLVEVLVSIVVVAVLAALFIPAFARTKPRSDGVKCVSKLKQVGLAFRMWSNENGEQFPWGVSMTNGGTLEFATSPQIFRHFLAISNELTSPKLLTCNADTQRTRVFSWHQLTNNAPLSYFVGLDADENKPQTILSGDRNLTTNGKPARGFITFDSNLVFGFSREIHMSGGNIGLADGSVYQVTPYGLQKQNGLQFSTTGRQSIRLVIP